MTITTVGARWVRCACHGRVIRLIGPGWRHLDRTPAVPPAGLRYDLAVHDRHGNPLGALVSDALADVLAEADRWHAAGARQDLTDLTVYV